MPSPNSRLSARPRKAPDCRWRPAARSRIGTPRRPKGRSPSSAWAPAGGLEAFRSLLAGLPLKSGMAYVLVQHLDPRHESILAELLAKGSRLPVSEVKADTAIEPDHV